MQEDWQVWIGLVEVEQRPGTEVLMDRNRAFANVLAFAASKDEFEEVARRAFDGLGFDVIDVETPEPLRTRLDHATVDEELLRLAEDVESDGRPRVGTFYTWRSER